MIGNFSPLVLVALIAAGSTIKTGLESLDHRDKLYDIHVQGKNVLVVGYPGRILRSSDAGMTWKVETASTREALLAVDFGDELSGIIVGRGGLAMRTKDGGKSWARAKTDVAEPLFDVDMVDSKKAGYLLYMSIQPHIK